jgi:two-component system response regulator AtoC
LDPDANHRESLQVLLAQHGHEAKATGEAETAVRELRGGEYQCVLCDRAFVAAILAAGLDVTVVSIGESLDAYDWLAKPVHPQSLDQVFRRVGERIELIAENQRLRDRLRPPTAPPNPDAAVGGMVGDSEPMRRVFREVRKVAPYKASVLITGESGTGKELVARAIHDLSPRAHAPFVAINCGAIPPTLLESELFGHAKGAFTDAVRDKRGMFLEAHGGTLFLDEIGELPLELQVKLLRALQEEEVRPIGDNASVRVDVRVIAATVRNLEAAVKRGLFRDDLYYRLNVVPMHLPELRKRKDDIPGLVTRFVEVYGRKHGPSGMVVEGVSEQALARLMAYEWPGNIRELENTIERAMVLCEDTLITPDLLEAKLRIEGDLERVAAVALNELSIKKTTRTLERQLIEKALERTGGNRTNAAKLLEISHRALLYKIKEYGLKP